MHSNNFYISSVSEVSICDGDYIMLSGTSYVPPSPVKPTEGKHDLKSCKGCRETRDHIVKQLDSTDNNFPFCCERHRKLVNISSFDKKHFSDISVDVANKSMYVHHHMMYKIDEPDWNEDICNYIDYVIRSFGSFPEGYGSPYQISNFYHFFSHLSGRLKNDVTTSEELSKSEIKLRISKIIQYVDDKFITFDSESKLPKKDALVTNLNLLLNTYTEWYKIFPFDLSYFEHLKSYYAKNIPILKGRPNYNKYLGAKTMELHTSESLIDELIGITKNIITSINGATLYDKGQLDNTSNLKLELTMQNRLVELAQIKLMDTGNRSSFVKILKKWFKGEKKFIDDIIPYLKDNHTNPVDNNDKTSTSKDIKDLFNSEEHYKKAVNILEKNKFIKLDGDSMRWIFTETKEYKTKQAIIAMCVVLEKEGYLISSPRSVYSYVHSTFSIKIDKGTYSRSSNKFKEDYDKIKTKNYSYTALFKNILSNPKL